MSHGRRVMDVWMTVGKDEHGNVQCSLTKDRSGAEYARLLGVAAGHLTVVLMETAPEQITVSDVLDILRDTAYTTVDMILAQHPGVSLDLPESTSGGG